MVFSKLSPSLPRFLLPFLTSYLVAFVSLFRLFCCCFCSFLSLKSYELPLLLSRGGDEGHRLHAEPRPRRTWRQSELIINSRGAAKSAELVARLYREKNVDTVPVAFDVNNAEDVRGVVASWRTLSRRLAQLRCSSTTPACSAATSFSSSPRRNGDTLVVVNEKSDFLVSQVVGLT